MQLDYLNALAEAINKGFTGNFSFNGNGSLYSHDTKTSYEIPEITVTAVHLNKSRVTLYLIATNDGINGTHTDFWEHSSEEPNSIFNQ